MPNRGKTKTYGEKKRKKKKQQSSGKPIDYPNPVVLWNEGQDLA